MPDPLLYIRKFLYIAQTIYLCKRSHTPHTLTLQIIWMKVKDWTTDDC